MRVNLYRKISLILGILWLGSAAAEVKEVNIAIISDGESEWSQQVISTLRAELESMSDSSFSYKVPGSLMNSASWSSNSAKDELVKALNKPEGDIIVSLGVISSSVTPGLSKPKPLIASAVINPKQQGFPISINGGSGVKNFHYLTANGNVSDDLIRFQRAVGGDHMALIIDDSVAGVLPPLDNFIDNSKGGLGFNISVIRLDAESIEQSLSSLPSGVDSVFMLPQFRLNNDQRKVLAGEFQKRELPSYSAMGAVDVENGFLMGSSLVPEPAKMARQLAIDIRDISLGRKASELNVNSEVNDVLTLNMEVASVIGYEPLFDILFEAEVIKEDLISDQRLTLVDAVDQSLAQNLSLAISSQDVLGTKEDVRISRSALLPQVNATLNLDSRDRDLVGSGAPRTALGGLSFSQSIYSDSVRATYQSSKYIYKAQTATAESIRLDIIEQTARAYLTLLVNKTEREIQIDNLKLTKANLDRARFRFDVGSVGKSEVLRFESELGNAQQSASNSERNLSQAAHALNQVLHRPIDETVFTVEPSLNDPKLFGDERLGKFISNPRKLKVFTNYLAQQAQNNAPELISLDAQIAAQEKLLFAIKRKRYVPEVSLVSSVDRILKEDGASVSVDQDENWSIGLQLSLPLYQGSGIKAERRKSEVSLKRLQLQKKQTAENIELLTRNAVAAAGASRRNIAYANASKVAAEKTLTLITDSYVRGQVNYIDLIDAQNSYLVSRLSSSNSIYQHLLDLMSLQREIGFFDFNVSPEQKDAWFEKLNAFEQNTAGK